MKCLTAHSLKEAIRLYKQNPNFALLAGGSDLNVQIFNKSIKHEGLIALHPIKKLAKIKCTQKSAKIGALCTISDIIDHESIQKHFPLLLEMQNDFASKQIRNMATIGGNIANASPFSDLIPLLLVLNAKIKVISSKGKRTIALKDLYRGYKKLDLNNEILISIILPIKEHQFYYKKIAPRKRLAIAKLSLAVTKGKKFRVSGSALNSSHRRFKHIEKCFNAKQTSDRALKEAIDQDIAPSTSYRSDPKYKKQVLFNMLKEAIEKLS